MPKRYTFLASCPSLDGQAIQAMEDESSVVGYRTMLRHCQELKEIARSLCGYENSSRQGHGLTLADDWHVAYRKSRYDGMRCYFLVWSAMEFVWVHEDDLKEWEGFVNPSPTKTPFTRGPSH